MRTSSKAPSIAGTRNGTRTALSFGSQILIAMFRAIKTTTAIAGGHRDSPMSSSWSAAG